MTINIFKKIRHIFNYRNYDYEFILWRFRSRYRQYVFILSKQTGTIRRIGLIITALLVAHILVRFVGISSLPASSLAVYLVSAGAMTGGIIAIVFTLSIFAQQSAADLYSSQYFEVYTHDWKEKFTYTVIVIITLLFFGAGVFFNSNSQVVTETIKISGIYFSLILIGLIFALVDWQYKNVRTKVNPINALKFLEDRAIIFLNSTHKDAKRIAKIIKARNADVSEDLALASAYNSYLSPYLTDLDRQIENLFEISMKLSDRQEIKTTNRGLTAVHNILAKYFELRRTSSLALASHLYILAVESDSQSFLTKTLERLRSTGEKFIRAQKVENATFIIDIYKSLANHSKEIKFINRSNENPIFEQIKGYFGFYIDFAIREKDQEIVFQSTQALSHFALIAIEKNLQAPLLGIQGDLLKLAIFGITERKTFIVDECINGWLRILRAVFHYRFFVVEHAIDEALKNIKAVTVYMHIAIKSGYLNRDIITKMSLSKPYDELIGTIGIIVREFFKLTEEKDKSYYKRSLINLFDELYNNLRRLSEEIHDCDSPLIDSIGRLIFNVNSLIIDLMGENEFKEERTKSELQKQLGWNIHLPYWFAHYTEKFRASNAFNTLTDSVAKTGIALFQKNLRDDLIMDCVNSLYSMVEQCLKKIEEKYGFDEPRQMEKIVYLGVLALKHNRMSILTKIKEQIREFEEFYKKKYLSNLKLPPGIDPGTIVGLPKGDQLLREVFDWRDEFAHQKYNRHRLLNTAREMMYEVIDELDIDRFMFEIWGKFPAHSPIEKEIKEKLKKSSKKKKVCSVKYGGIKIS